MTAETLSGRAYVEWAGKDLAKWKRLKGQTVRHRHKGLGVVHDVKQEGRFIILGVEIPNEGIRDYYDRFFAGTFLQVFVDSSVAAAIRGQVLPAHDAELQRIRRKIVDRNVLQENELRWLGENEYIAELEEYLGIHGKDWPVAKVGAYWRKAAMPNRNLKVTEAIEQGRSTRKAHGPVWTTRGAAFADLEAMDEAERCANSGSSCDPKSYYPWNLLGRIYRYLGDHDKADEAFRKAKDLGSSEKSQRRSDLHGRHGRLRKSQQELPPTPPDADAHEQEDHEVPF